MNYEWASQIKGQNSFQILYGLVSGQRYDHFEAVALKVMTEILKALSVIQFWSIVLEG